MTQDQILPDHRQAHAPTAKVIGEAGQKEKSPGIRETVYGHAGPGGTSAGSAGTTNTWRMLPLSANVVLWYFTLYSMLALS